MDPWSTGFTVFSLMVIILSIGKGGEIMTRARTLAGDYPNEMRWDHLEL